MYAMFDNISEADMTLTMSIAKEAARILQRGEIHQISGTKHTALTAVVAAELRTGNAFAISKSHLRVLAEQWASICGTFRWDSMYEAATAGKMTADEVEFAIGVDMGYVQGIAMRQAKEEWEKLSKTGYDFFADV
jgi:hypothetical protein